MAREIRPLMNCPYFAGHWETDLIYQLGWVEAYSSPVHPSYKPSNEYTAPSWAWASSTHSIYGLARIPLSPLAEVTDEQIELLTSDTMGQVKSGHLKLRGQLIEFQVDQIRDKYSENISVYVDGPSKALVFGPNALYKTTWLVPIYISSTEWWIRCLILVKVDDMDNRFR